MDPVAMDLHHHIDPSKDLQGAKMENLSQAYSCNSISSMAIICASDQFALHISLYNHARPILPQL